MTDKSNEAATLAKLPIPGRAVCALLPDPGSLGVVKVREWPAVPAAMTH